MTCYYIIRGLGWRSLDGNHRKYRGLYRQSSAITVFSLFTLMIVFFAFISIAGYVAWRYIQLKRRGYPFPPGPPADPILGHLRVIPLTNMPEKYHEWSKIYGMSISTVSSCNILRRLS